MRQIQVQLGTVALWGRISGEHGAPNSTLKLFDAYLKQAKLLSSRKKKIKGNFYFFFNFKAPRCNRQEFTKFSKRVGASRGAKMGFCWSGC